MRVVIADDEYLVQETLISMIAELEEGWTIVGVASDGRELVELILKHKPDLAIVDIKMPYISGLEAIQMTLSECPNMQSVVLTGYSEFTFAREALQLGAVNYLLKPVNSQELKSTLAIVKQNQHKLELFNNKKMESAIISKGYGLLLESQEEDLELADLKFRLCVFYMDSGLPEMEQAALIQAFYQNMKKMLDKRVDAQFRYAFIFLTNGELALAGAYNKSSNHIKAWDVIIQEIEKMLQVACTYGFCLTPIVKDSLTHSDLKAYFAEIHQASALRILYGVNKKWRLNDLEKNKGEEDINWCKAIIALVKSFKEGSYANYVNRCHEIKELQERTKLLKNKAFQYSISHYLNNTLLAQIDASTTPTDWILAIKDHGQKLLAQIPKSERPQDIIQQVLLFIEKNYMNDINIMQIADELQVTPNYLSTVFHKKMDITFIKYLTRIRLIKAQQFLLEAKLQVQEVAEKVGYVNPRYFTKLFTEFSGCYPSDYKKHLTKSSPL